ncbi:MAG: hypothetical protein LBU53_13905 [Zoogloeaceae bacterium]|nr:hypothetical protein [Zoogloeaceae bacterium]
MKFIESRKLLTGFAMFALVFAASACNPLADEKGQEQVQDVEEATKEKVDVDLLLLMARNAVELSEQGKLEEAIAVYDEFVRRFNKADAGADILELVVIAQANAAEAALVLGRNQDAVQRAKAVQARLGTSSPGNAIMSFIIWLADEKTPLQTVQDAIQGTSSDEDAGWNWSFEEVSPLIAKLPDARRKQAECFVSYFESSDADSLNACLKQ